MTPKQARFIAEYLVDLNGTQAAIRAGYSAKTAYSISEELLKKPEIASAVAKSTQRQLENVGITAERVKARLGALAFADIRSFYDTDGNLKPLKDLTEDQAAAIAGFEVIKKNAAAGDGIVDTVHKIKIADQLKALEMLGKHFGLFTEKVEHSGALEVKWVTE